MSKFQLKCIFFFLSKNHRQTQKQCWFEHQFDYNSSFRFEMWHDSKVKWKMSPKSLYEPWLRCVFSAEIQDYINFIWLCLLQVFPTTLLRNFWKTSEVFLFWRTSPGHPICRLISHNKAAPRISSWDAKLTVGHIHVVGGSTLKPSHTFINTMHISVLCSWIVLEICHLKHSITWQDCNSLHSLSDNKYQ